MLSAIAMQNFTVVLVPPSVNLEDLGDLSKPSVVRTIILLDGVVIFDMSVTDDCVNVFDSIKAHKSSTDEWWWCTTNAHGFSAVTTMSFQQLEHGISKNYANGTYYVH